MNALLTLSEGFWGLLVVNGALPLWLSRRRSSVPGGPRPECVVLVPAWNEAERVAETLAAIEKQLAPADRLIVIADNCRDQTAAIARGCARAEVWERNDTTRLGKHHALRFAIARLSAPPVTIVIDADSRLAPGTLHALAAAAWRSRRPQQAAYRLTVTDETSASSALSAFAFSWLTEARPRGKARLRLPCVLNGNGMAFTAEHLAIVARAPESLVEDRQWTIALAQAGHAPRFCAAATVESPAGARGWIGQHRRWESGTLAIVFRRAPGLLAHALRRGDGEALALALDLLTPPATLLALVGAALWLVDKPTATYFLFSFAFWFGGLAISARRDLSWRRLASGVPGWCLGKARVYFDLLRGRRADWGRAESDPAKREARR